MIRLLIGIPALVVLGFVTLISQILTEVFARSCVWSARRSGRILSWVEQ